MPPIDLPIPEVVPNDDRSEDHPPSENSRNPNKNLEHNQAHPMGNVRDPVERLIKYHVPHATYDTLSLDHRCMRGTRVGVLNEAKRLITCRGGSPIVWISGMTGTGKTSIALSLCDLLVKEKTVLLGGTFFFARVGRSIKRNISKHIIPTLATLLIREEPACEKTLRAELTRDPDFLTKTVNHQIANLLVKPLDSLAPFDRQIVFVIDGLDQCSDKKQLRELVLALADFECQVPAKFLITARPDPRIRKIRIRRSNLHPQIELYSIDLAMITANIQHHIEADDAVHHVPMEFENQSATPGWYSDRDPAELAEKEDDVFASAAATFEYVISPKETSRQAERVRKAKELKAKGLNSLDEMYSFMLAQAVELASFKADRIRTIIAAIITSRMPLQVKTLADLLRLKSTQIRNSLIDLHAVVFVPENDKEGELRMLQKTFVDFFVKDVAEDQCISKSYGHDALARGCLQRLAADDLRLNISKTDSSYDSDTQPEPQITPSLRHACMFWPYYIYNAAVPAAYDDQIYTMLLQKFLFWLEVTSRIVEADHSPELLLKVAASRAKSEALSDFLRDAISFVESFQEAIRFNAAHIYISALPFTPKDSLIYRTFYPRFSGLISAEAVGTDLQGELKIIIAAVSPDGRVIVSAASDGSVRMLKAGEKDSVTLDHEGEVLSVAFSVDSRLVATGSSDTVVRIWSAATGQPVMEPRREHQSAVQAISFSPDSTRLAAGSADGTVRVWSVKAASATWQQRLKQQVAQIPTVLAFCGLQTANTSISSIAYSPDGDHIALGYNSGFVQILSATTGVQWRSFPDRTSDDIKSLVFSSDGRFIWYTPGQDVFRVNVEKKSKPITETGCAATGNAATVHVAQVNVVARSTNGRLIVSGANDATIRLWDSKTGEPRGSQLVDHDGPVISVTVSTDNNSLYSVGSDGTVREWNLTRTPSEHLKTILTLLREQRYEEGSGWLVDPSHSNRRLLWVPPEYRDGIKVSFNSRVITARWSYVGVSSKDDELYYGERWAECWSTGKQLGPLRTLLADSLKIRS